MTERLHSFSNKDLKMEFAKINLGQIFEFLLCHNFETKIRLLIKTAIHVHLNKVKFSSLFKESLCSPVVTFPSFGSEEHGVQLPQRDSFFPYLSANFTYLFCKVFFLILSFKPSNVSVKNPVKKRHQTCLTVKYVYLVTYFFFI